MLKVTRDSFELAYKICRKNNKLINNCNPIALAIYKSHTNVDRGISVDMQLERTKIKTVYASKEYRRRNLPTDDLYVVNSQQVQSFFADFYALATGFIEPDVFGSKWSLPMEINFKDDRSVHSRRWFPSIHNWINQCKSYWSSRDSKTVKESI